MRRFPQWTGFLALLLVCFPLSAQNPLPSNVYVRRDQKAELPADLKLATARQNCQNWGLAAGLETLLQRQKVALDQVFWVMRLNGGELCVNALPKPEALAQAINQEFTLGDGRHIRLELRFVPGAPVNIDSVIAGLKQQQLSVLVWRGHPYYLTGITYDEYIRADGTRQFAITEMRLADTFARQPASAFQRGRDNPSEIAGILSVSVMPE